MGRFLLLKDNMFLSGRMLRVFKNFYLIITLKLKKKFGIYGLKYDELDHENIKYFRKICRRNK